MRARKVILKHKLTVVLSLCWIILVTYTEGNAQFSWKPKPYPECKSFAVTEFGILARLSDPAEGRTLFYDTEGLYYVDRYRLSGRFSLFWDFGIMWNLDRHNATQSACRISGSRTMEAGLKVYWVADSMEDGNFVTAGGSISKER